MLVIKEIWKLPTTFNFAFAQVMALLGSPLSVMDPET